ncbi:MAG: hypothetical protein ARM1_0343 [Candidatus Micrarchaeota archaeon]|nr:MAG: hypothetical protein ARM1_0343 [Candidatus Micrarchaeota archaeon]
MGILLYIGLLLVFIGFGLIIYSIASSYSSSSSSSSYAITVFIGPFPITLSNNQDLAFYSTVVGALMVIIVMLYIIISILSSR